MIPWTYEGLTVKEEPVGGIDGGGDDYADGVDVKPGGGIDGDDYADGVNVKPGGGIDGGGDDYADGVDVKLTIVETSAEVNIAEPMAVSGDDYADGVDVK